MSSILTDNIDDANKPYRVIESRIQTYHFSFGHHSFAIAQLEERVTVNHDVTGSSPVGGVVFILSANYPY